MYNFLAWAAALVCGFEHKVKHSERKVIGCGFGREFVMGKSHASICKFAISRISGEKFHMSSNDYRNGTEFQ